MASIRRRMTDNLRTKSFNQHIGAIVVSLGGFTLGVSVGWCSSVTEGMRIRFIASITELGIIGNVLNVGACLGVIIAIWIFKFHHWISGMIKILLYAIGWSVISLGNENTFMIVIGRFVCGISGGMSCLLVPLFISDIADKKTRNRLLILFQLLINCGIMYAFLMAHVLDGGNIIWRYSTSCGASCIILVLLRFIPASPFYYLASIDNDESRAKNSLSWYRQNENENENDYEMEELRQLAILRRTAKMRYGLMKNRRVLHSFLMCFGVMMIHQFSGFSTFITYALTIFETQGSGLLNGSELTLVVGIVQILSCLLAYTLIDVLGRRILLTISSAFMGLFLGLLGWFFDKRLEDPEYDDWYWWMPPTWISLYFISLNLGVAPISWALLADSFPQQINLLGAGFAAISNWILSILAMIVFGSLQTDDNIRKAVWLFAIICWFGAIFSAVLIKDNGKKSLNEIEKDFRIDDQEETN
ncbi:facilitated trehalose transporter Tret1-like [Vespa velutina]|uniref:facilitated trehalose transporter Tret1-like n=1 Tax=Vespa velutina TaxID=202808 RepID=UPI001FB4BF02|nr:facilitated trehalose transporter Tret1-like [Vespa velutina]